MKFFLIGYLILLCHTIGYGQISRRQWEKNRWGTEDSIRFNDTVRFVSAPFYSVQRPLPMQFSFYKKRLFSIRKDIRGGRSQETGFNNIWYDLVTKRGKQFVIIYDEYETYFIWQIISAKSGKEDSIELMVKVLYSNFPRRK